MEDLPRIIALLCFYDESRETLAQCVAGLKHVGVDHLVAVDGRYELFRGDDHWSPVDQHHTLLAACHSLGLGLTIHAPQGPWGGNEPQKRTHLFMLGLAESDPGDWLLVVDADEMYVKGPPPGDLHRMLADTDLEVARVACRDMNVAAWKQKDPDKVKHTPEYFGVRKLFRAQPLVVGPNHYTYSTLDGRRLFTAAGEENEPEPSLDLREHVEMHHRPGVRALERQGRKDDYYHVDRPASLVEFGRCQWEKVSGKGETCEEQAVAHVHCNPRRTDHGINVDRLELCAKHGERARQLRVGALRSRLGVLCGCPKYVREANTGQVCQSCGKAVREESALRWVDRLDPDARADRKVAPDGEEVPAAEVARRVFAEATG